MPPGNYGADGVGKMVGGKHWVIPVIVPDGKDADATWAIMKPAFLNNGWTSMHEWTSGGRFLWMHYTKNGVEAYATLYPGDPQRAMVEIVEIAPPPITLVLVPPAATPELIDAAKGDFPYLTPVSGSRYRGGTADTAPFYITPKGASVAELVAPGSIIKAYSTSESLSNSFFRVLYHDALIKAGWTIVNESSAADVSISAHYTQNGRNLWAALHKNNDGYDIRVADAGAATQGLSSDLAQNCHVALYGILFDFNKSTLQPASDPVLQQILALFTKNPALQLEIQGHTDNVGGDAYNQTLSESRAHAVVLWLVQHGVAAARLTARGYGKTVPIADNNTDTGRAKNRRVEIADPRCTAKGK